MLLSDIKTLDKVADVCKNLHKNYRQVHVVYMLITYIKTTDVDNSHR